MAATATPRWRSALPDWGRLFDAEALERHVSRDLGDAIGSRRWFAGLALCTALVGGATWLGLGIPALPVMAPPAASEAERAAIAPAIIAPLARGGTTGREAAANPRLVEPLAEAPERPRLELTVRTGGGGFEGALRRAGVGAGDIGTIQSLLRGVANPGALPRNTEIDLVLGRRESRSVPRPVELLGFRAAFDLRVAIRRVDGALQLQRIPIAVDSTPLRVTGTVGGNLQRALRAAGVPVRLVGEFTRVMGYAADLQRVGKADRFAIVIEQDKAETGEVRHGELLFAGLERKGKDPVELGRYSFGGKPEFFKADGESARKGLMKTPVDGARLTSGFGMRFHPLLAYSRMHQGVDFGAGHGTPIMAAAGGTVSFAGRHGGHGNYVQLRHTGELVTAYAHMSRFAVKAGQRVSQGQVIGYVGSTGLSTGPHLHYEVWLRGRPVNPVQLKFIGGTQLSGSALGQFMAQMNRWRSLPAVGSAPKSVVIADADDKKDGRGRGR